MAGTLSLTPRETSSGLRPPRLAVARGLDPAQSSGDVLPPARGASSRPSNLDSDDPAPIPTREGLRNGARMLRERRVQKPPPGKSFDPSDAMMESLATAIRQRTSLTMQQAHSQPDSANIFAAREQELQRQRGRLEDLRRTYDLLHADFVGKEDIRKMLELTLSTDKRAPADQAASAPLPRAPSKSSPRGLSGEPTDEELARLEAGHNAGSTSVVAHKDPSARPAWTTLTQMTPLEEVTERVRVAQEELHEMLHSCEVLAFMEQRTRMANHKMEGELEKLRHMVNKLHKEEEEIRELVRRHLPPPYTPHHRAHDCPRDSHAPLTRPLPHV